MYPAFCRARHQGTARSIPRQLRQGRVQAESVSPQLITLSAPGRAPAQKPGKSVQKRRKGQRFSSPPRLPGERQLLPVHPRRRASGGWLRGKSPRCLTGRHSSLCPRSPMMYVGKDGSSMADKAVCSAIPVMPTAHTGPKGTPGKAHDRGFCPGMPPCG